MGNKLLEVKNLQVFFYTDEGIVKAVNDISFDVRKGEVVGLVGESGCGKSVTAMSILKLIPTPPGKIVGGQILLNGEDLVPLSTTAMKNVRGRHISMIFQEPMTSLNPVLTAGFQIIEGIVAHQDVSKEDATRRAIEMLGLVGIPNPEKRFYEYPHQMSGGMRQRVMIAMALCCQPSLLIADEPTTALDVTIQAQILDLIGRLQKELGMSVLLITHDLGIVAEFCHRVVVMYASKIVETGPVNDIYKTPRHPYTQGLIQSIPNLTERQQYLYDIPGTVPSPRKFPAGCKFHPRCPHVMDICRTKEPKLEVCGENHAAACWLVKP
jgi:oligopeptide/dipeptide ABC transporter ATP-binding protein